jgi:hypothetical protein
MAKYDPLREHLRSETRSEFTMSFREIETIIGAALPGGAHRALWWANGGNLDGANVQRWAWRDASFTARLHAGRKVKFKKSLVGNVAR